ncbi:hypothetical protein ACFOOK_11540 [Micromonospora krabiensis]|uniref:Uncharacterized protein n=1 Tax=Micromonospora krabiensis TaxID=307121 RepID=A0A1C3N301_9ACTN|nr:hypothetical protein [Micromonospora krabiensis]SBV26936.1 hypothetical protein GA0070620_2433 [Micromonospora krabiensis]
MSEQARADEPEPAGQTGTDGPELTDQPSPAVVRRRRWLLPTAGLSAVLLLIVTVAVAAPWRESSPRPVAEPTPVLPSTAAPAPTASPTAAPSLPPSPSPVPAAVATASSAARPTTRPAAARSSGPTRRPSVKPTPTPACTPAGVVDVVDIFTYGVVTVAARTDGKSNNQLCSGERIRVFWATYARTADGGSKLYRSQVRYLDRSQPRWTMTLVLPEECGDSWYVVRGTASIPQTLKPGVVPFGRNKVHWDTPDSC